MMFAQLLLPRLLAFKKDFLRHDRRGIARDLILFFMGFLFWCGIFLVFYRVLLYFQGIEVIGDILASKLLSMVFLCLFSVLIFSNIVTALSTYFLSDDLEGIISHPVSLGELYFSRFIETLLNSSWMTLLFGLPVFLAYGMVYQAGLFYYIMLLAVIIPFLIIPAGIGSMITLIMVSVLPARRLKDILILLSILFFIALYFFFRMLQPERLVDPEVFSGLMDYMASLKAPVSPFFPSQWAVDCLSPILLKGVKDYFPFGLLFVTGLAVLAIGEEIFSRTYFDAWSKSQEAKTAKISKSWWMNSFLNWIVQPFSPSTRALVIKDLKVFFRDTHQWPQLFLIFALITIYLYNFSVLPLNKSPIPTFYLQNLVSFLNLGLAGFALAAVAVRFSFPAVSMEGKSFWIIQSSPLHVREFVRAKFWMNFFFLFILAEILTIYSNYLLHATPFIMILSAVTMGLMTFGITSLGIGLGSYFPRFKVENVAQIPTGFGGLVYMIFAISFIGAVVILEARPVYIIFMAKIKMAALTFGECIEIGISFFMVGVINVLAFFLPLKYGIRKLSQMENV
jgi:ABC-2 type transport system permease protein